MRSKIISLSLIFCMLLSSEGYAAHRAGLARAETSPPAGFSRSQQSSMSGWCGDGLCSDGYENSTNCPSDCPPGHCGEEGDLLGGEIDHCCPGLKPKQAGPPGVLGGLFKCVE